MAKKECCKNLLSFNDFSGELPLNKQKKTKRTDVGLDILNEDIYADDDPENINDDLLQSMLNDIKKIKKQVNDLWLRNRQAIR